jgi:SAM-dependent methyltransferase
MRPSTRVLAHAVRGPSALFSRLFEVPWYRLMLQDWIDGLGLAPQSPVLDVGSAGGELAGWLAGGSRAVTGVDLSERSVAVARERFPDVNFRVGSALDLPLADRTVAAAIGASLINVVPDRQRALMEMGRVTVPGGFVSVLFPAAGFSDADVTALISDSGFRGFDAAALRTWHVMAHKCEVAGIEADCRAAGLGDVRSQFMLGGMVATTTATVAP